MIPSNLLWAYEDGHPVRTLGGDGVTIRRRLADLLLPTGRLALGFPGTDGVNVPALVGALLPRGCHPVFVTLAHHDSGGVSTAFALVCLGTGLPVTWEPAGAFFTDSGDGCLYDASRATQLADRRSEMGWQAWWRLKESVLLDGDGSLLLDEVTGANAILFPTYDWHYPAYLGRGESGQPVGLVVDCRWEEPKPD